MSTDFHKGFWTGLGVGAALLVVAFAAGLARKVI